MAAISVPAAYKKLVTVLAHMFYSGHCPPAWWVDASEPKKPDNTAAEEMGLLEEKKAAQLAREAKKKAQQDTAGLGIVLLGALVERQWVEEDELARDLNLPAKMVRRAMRFMEQEQLVVREHRKESVRGRRKEREMLTKAGLRGSEAAGAAAAGGAGTSGAAGAAAAAADAELAGLPPDEDDEPINKGHVISYCALDYPRIVDSVRWRIAMVKRNLHKEIRGGHAVQLYKCPVPDCGKEYSSMDVFELMSRGAGGGSSLTCGICGTEIEMVLDEGGKHLGSMEDKKERVRKAKAMLEACDTALAPLTQQLAAIEGLETPDFDTYANWLTKQVATRQRLQGLANQAAASNKHNQSTPTISSSTQVVLNFKPSSSGTPGQADAADPGSSSGAAAGAAASRPAAGGAGAAGAAGAAAGAAAGSRLPPWMAPKAAAAAAPAAAASKPVPPWLLSSVRQQQQQPTPAAAGIGNGSSLDLPGLKTADEAAGLKPDPDFEPAKLDFSAAKQDADGMAVDEPVKDEDEDDWEDIGGDSKPAAGNGAKQVHGTAAADAADEDDWEDV